MGKTRLVNESAARLAAQFGARVLEGRCLPYGEANVWWPIADLVRHLFDLVLDEPMDVAERRLTEALAAHLDPSLAHEFDRFVIALLHALGYDTELRGGDRSRNRSEVMLAFTTIVDAEIARRPVVLLLSDMHWAPEAVWLLIDHLLAEMARSRLVVLMTARPTEDDQLPRGRHGLSVIQLGPLDERASAELLNQLGIDLPESSVGDLVDRSGGNPFFLEELAELVGSDGQVSAQSEFDVDLEGLPATLRGTVAARLDALVVGQRALLENASVLGRNGTLDGLYTLAAQTRGADDVSADLAGLVEKDLLEITGTRYRFVSNLVRDVAYGRLTKTVRAQQHHGIANYLESMQKGTVRNSRVVAIAEHYRAAAQLSAEVSMVPGVDSAEVLSKALHWLEEAGGRALDVGALAQALRWYDVGAELARDDSNLATFLFGRVRVRNELRDLAGARVDLDRLEALPNIGPVLSAKALLLRGEIDRKAGELGQAAARLREAADRLAALGVPDQQALALRLLGMTEAARSDDSMARQALETSRSVAVEAGDRRGEAWALQSMASHAFALGRVNEARTLVDEAIDTFNELEDRGGLIWAQGVQAWVAFHSGEWDEARQLIDTVLPEIRRRGDPWAEGIMLILDASLQLWSGNATAAVDLARQARSVAERIEDVALGVQARAFEGRALVSLGQIDEGTKLVELAYTQADDPQSRRIALIANCASAARMGEPERAIRWAARFDGHTDDPSVVGESDLAVSLALALLQRGAASEAATQLSWVEPGEDRRSGHFASAVGSLIAAASGDRETAETLAARTMRAGATYLDRVYAHLARAAVAYRLDDVSMCEKVLADARDLLDLTDDQPTRQLLDLAVALYLLPSSHEAERRMRSGGFDPEGWTTALRTAAGMDGPVG